MARDRLLRVASAAERFPLKFDPARKLKAPTFGFEKVEVAKVPVILAEPVTSRAYRGSVLLIPK